MSDIDSSGSGSSSSTVVNQIFGTPLIVGSPWTESLVWLPARQLTGSKQHQYEWICRRWLG